MNHKHGSFEELLLHNLFQGLLRIVVVGIFVTGFYTYTLTGVIDDKILLGWFFTFCLFNLLRLYYRQLYFKSPGKFTSKQWQNRYFFCATTVGAAWGTISFFLINKLPHDYELISIAYIAGMVAGGAIGNIAHKKSAIIYSTVIFIPFGIRTVVEAGTHYEIFLFAMSLFMYVIYQAIRNLNEVVTDSFLMTVEQEKLLGQVQGKLDLEKELRKQKIRAMQSSKLVSLGEMAAGVAHEINNPLTISLGKLDLLYKKVEQDKISKEKVLSEVVTIREASRRVANIVLSMRNLSRVKDEAELQEFTLQELVDIAKPLYQQKLHFYSIEMRSDYKALSVFADLGECSQVLLNLIGNAIDAIKEDQNEKKWIQISSLEEEDHILLKVIDSGIGIEKETLESIFDPFFTTKKIGEGTGLGLSLSKNLMQKSKGDLYYESSCGNTCFVMKLKKEKK